MHTKVGNENVIINWKLPSPMKLARLFKIWMYSLSNWFVLKSPNCKQLKLKALISRNLRLYFKKTSTFFIVIVSTATSYKNWIITLGIDSIFEWILIVELCVSKWIRYSWFDTIRFVQMCTLFGAHSKVVQV